MLAGLSMMVAAQAAVAAKPPTVLWYASITAFSDPLVVVHEPTAEQACQDVADYFAANGPWYVRFSGSEYRAYPNVLDCYFDRLNEDGTVASYRKWNFPASLNCAPKGMVFVPATKSCDCPAFTTWRDEANNGEGACVRYIDRNHDNPGQCPSAGNPMFPMTGAKTQREEIGRWLPAHALAAVFDNRQALPLVDDFGRFARQAPASFGPYWHSSLHKQLIPVVLNSSSLWMSVAAARGGHVWKTYTRTSSNAYLPAAAGTNSRVYDLSNTWRLVDPDAGAIETYSYQGVLASTAYAGGGRLTHTYSTSSTPHEVAPAAGLLLSIQDHFGRALQFQYEQPTGVSAPRIKSIIDPQGQTAAARYDAAGNLSELAWADGLVRRFAYERPDLPWALTGVIDENGQRHSTYGYDSQGRAASTESAGGVNRYTVSYGEPPSWMMAETYSAGSNLVWRDHTWRTPTGVVLTGPNGSTSQMQATSVLGMPRLASQDQPAGAGCDASTSSYTYDANGNVASRVDFNGSRTCHAHDLSRNLETARLEGLASTDACPADIGAQPIAAGGNQRKTMTEWHPDWRLPAKRAEPGKITISVYNGQPDPTLGNAVASCAPASAVLPDGKPIAVLCKQIEQATSDTTGASGFAAADPSTVPVQAVAGDPDPWFSQVSLLLHFDGPAGGTSFADASTHAHVATTVASPLSTDPVDAKFGSAAGSFTGGYLHYPPSSAWDMGGGDFTVEMWAKFNTAAMGSRVFLLGQGASNGGNQTFFIGKNTANQLTMALTTTGTSASVAGTGTVAANTWYHLALVRSGNVLTLYRNGAVEATAAVSGAVPVRQAKFGIGVVGEYTAYYGGGSGTKMMGWLDEFRLTKGVARYTGPFAAPSRPFGDANGVAGYVPRVRVHAYTYNEFGQVLTARDPSDRLTTYAYYSDTTDEHTQGDLQSITNASGQVTRYTRYDRGGRVLQSMDANGAVTDTTYAPRGWVRTVTVTPVGAAPQVTVYDYDGVGQLKKAMLSDGTALEYSYDAAHRLTGVKDAAGNSVTYTLDNMGNRTGDELKDPNGTLARSMNRVFDALSRMQSAVGVAP